MQDERFQPYVPPEKELPELTPVSLVLGILLAVIFGGANAYLGLRVGMTVSASIPAAVISMGIVRKVLRRESILENNMVQTIGSAGESVAAGAIFTLPALFMWANEGLTAPPSLVQIGTIALCGGLLGVLLMIPLRSALIVREHSVLIYPEGQACAQVLVAGETGGAGASVVFGGLGVAAVYKFLADGLKLFPSQVDWASRSYRGAGIGADVLPALAGVGYICGAKVSSYLFAGGVLAWLVLMPLITLFGSDLILFPAAVTVGELFAAEGTWGIWEHYVKYIGAGAVAAGGIMSLAKSLPLIARTFWKVLHDYGKDASGTRRTERDIPTQGVLAGVLGCALVLWLLPSVPLNLLTALVVILFGFFFATVSSRMVGLIGASNNPVSGMTIATLLMAAAALKAAGTVGPAGHIAAITIGSLTCIIAAIAGDTSQDLKTGFLVGATPKRQQIGELVGCAAAAVAIGAILYLLNTAWGYGSKELPAAQATLMKMVVEGVLGGNLPWPLVGAGAFIAVAVAVLGVPVLPVAIGLYLPVHLSVPIVAGGLLRWGLERRRYSTEKEKETCVQAGVLYSSGLIAGEGVVGILLAVSAVVTVRGEKLADLIDISRRGFSLGGVGSLVCFGALLGSVWFAAGKKGRK